MGDGRAANLTQENDGDVAAFVAAVTDDVRRQDAEALVELMRRVTGEPPRLWGTSIVGFGRYHYAYASGREGDAPAAGFSPRASATTVYLMDGVDEHAELLTSLGRHRVGKGCLYVRRLSDVDVGVLEEIVRRSYATLTRGEPFGRRLSGPGAG
ncbi:DUF1801 domain-containing protein [Actinotalea subterranea]|uniref:DUF1801 domain-containing protein n=1 Tax=Actinotalea subterranea TaxID=2607497 RepID=UPI0011EC8C10|nr:DUF1801 domain-containing protein [Actinotalea subterranea]